MSGVGAAASLPAANGAASALAAAAAASVPVASASAAGGSGPGAVGNVSSAGTSAAGELGGARAPKESSSSSSSSSSPSAEGASAEGAPRRSSKEVLFERLMRQADVNLEELRSASWTGIPAQFRGSTWQILLGYLPSKLERRAATLRRKRREYFECLPMYYSNSDVDRSEEDQKMLVQILRDIPRTNPGMPLFHCDEVRSSFERMLYIWAIRHPASGYVQGMNDLVTPFYAVFLADQVCGGAVEHINAVDVSTLEGKSAVLDAVEADSYWCLTKLLDGIQDHYTTSQPGLQRMVYRLQGIVQRIDQPLHDHLVQRECVEFNMFAFRWMNCLLVRELELNATVRLWDTYFAEEKDGFDGFHVCFCSALLITWSRELQAMSFQDLLVFLQHLPTSDWPISRIEEVLGQAYILKTLFADSPNHLD